MSAPSSNHPGSPSAQPEPDFSLFETFEVPLQAMPELPVGDGYPSGDGYPDLSAAMPETVTAEAAAVTETTVDEPTAAEAELIAEAEPVTEAESEQMESEAEPVHDAAETVAETRRDEAQLDAEPEQIADDQPAADVLAADATQTVAAEAAEETRVASHELTESDDVNSESSAASEQIEPLSVAEVLAAAQAQSAEKTTPAAEAPAAEEAPVVEAEDSAAVAAPVSAADEYVPPVEMTWAGTTAPAGQDPPEAPAATMESEETVRPAEPVASASLQSGTSQNTPTRTDDSEVANVIDVRQQPAPAEAVPTPGAVVQEVAPALEDATAATEETVSPAVDFQTTQSFGQTAGSPPVADREPMTASEFVKTGAQAFIAEAEPEFERDEVQATLEAEPADQPVVDESLVAAAPPEKTNGFLPLNLRQEVQAAVAAAGYDEPTEIQARTIPHLLEGRDVLAQSQTGSGKTATFALPILSRLNTTQHSPQVLVLTPTRELATQVAEAIGSYGVNVPGFSVAAIYGGQGYETQLRQLKRGVPVVVGTPGRIIDHINRGTLKLNELKTLVLDEADEMLNMGFLDDVKFVLEQTPSDRQVALFSATMPPAIRGIAQHYLTDPARVTVNKGTMTAAAIRQRAVITAHRDKYDVLVRFLEIEPTDGIIVFAKTREATLELAEQLDRDGFPAAALNGDLPQRARERTVDQFKAGKLDVLVATDVAARGLDVSRVSHVFNFDVPQDTESYVHRIGRTGRAGRAGEAIILLSRSQKYKLRQIERLTKQAIEVVDVPTADQVNQARVARLCDRITKAIESKDLTRFAGVLGEFSQTSGHGPDQIAAALAHLAQNGRPFFVQDAPPRQRPDRNDRRSQDYGSNHDGPGRGRSRDRGDDRDRNRRDRGGEERRPSRNRPVPAGMDRYRIEVGHDDGVKPGNIVGAIANEGGIEGQYIGPINIFAGHSTIDLPEGMPADVRQTLHQIRVAGKQLRLRPATSSDTQQDNGFRKRRHGSGGPPSGGRRFSKGKPAGKFRSKKRDR